MEKMSKTEQRKMLKALDKAADYTKDGMSPDQALTKVAKEYDFNAPRIERLCEAYNKANAVAYMKTASEEDRAENHPIANINNVISNIYGEQEKTASELVFKKRDYASIQYTESMGKTASEFVPKTNITKQSIGYALEAIQGQLERLTKHAEEKRVKAERKVTNGLNELTGEIQKIPLTRQGRKQLEKIAQYMVDAYGEERGHLLINAVNANIDDPDRYMDCMPKKAKAVVLPSEKIYKIASQLMDDREHMLEMQKMAADSIEVADRAVGKVADNRLAAVLEDLPALLKAPSEPHMDISTGMTGEWDAYAKDLKSRRMLYDMMLHDEEIKGYSPRKTQAAYNDIVETFPELAQKRQILRAMLRKSLAQGGNMDIYEIKDLITAGKEHLNKGKTNAETRNRLSSNITNISNNNSNDVITTSIPISIGGRG